MSPDNRRRNREKTRRYDFNNSLGLLADALVRIDPGLREGGESGGCRLGSRPELLQAAAKKLASLHKENERNKRVMEALGAGQGATTASSRPPAARTFTSTAADAQQRREAHDFLLLAELENLKKQRKGIHPQQHDGRIRHDRPQHAGNDSVPEDLLHSRFSLQQLVIQPVNVPSSVASSTTVSDVSAPGGFSGSRLHNNNRLVTSMHPYAAASTTRAATTENLGRQLLLLRLQSMRRTISANVPLNAGGAQSIHPVLLLSTTPFPGDGCLEGAKDTLYPPPPLLESSSVLNSSAAREAGMSTGPRLLQSSKNRLGTSDSSVASAERPKIQVVSSKIRSMGHRDTETRGLVNN